MIIKARSIAHIRESLNYIVKDEKQHTFLDSDGVDIFDQKETLNDFGLYSKDRVKNGYVTMVISPNTQDSLNNEDYKVILKETLAELKLDNRQYIAVMHLNTENPHIHVLLNRIDYNNETWNDHHVAWKCQEACINITKKLKLKTAYHDKTAVTKKPKQNSHDRNRDLIKKELQKIVKNVMVSSTNLKSLHENLKSNEAEVIILKHKNGTYGKTLLFKNQKFKASSINRNLTLKINGNSYKPNERLQKIFDKNIERIRGTRTLEDINKENQSQNPSEDLSLQELVALHNVSVQTVPFIQNSTNDENEDDIKRKRLKRAKKTGDRSI